MLERLRSEFIAVISQRSVVTSFRSRGQLTVATPGSVNQPSDSNLPRLRSSDELIERARVKDRKKDGGRDFGITVANNGERERRFSTNYSKEAEEGGRGAGTARNVHAPRKLVSLPGRERERRMPLDAVSVRRTPTRERELTYGHEFLRTPGDPTPAPCLMIMIIFFENAPGEIIRLG